jgi:hypothetical protein
VVNGSTPAMPHDTDMHPPPHLPDVVVNGSTPAMPHDTDMHPPPHLPDVVVNGSTPAMPITLSPGLGVPYRRRCVCVWWWCVCVYIERRRERESARSFFREHVCAQHTCVCMSYIHEY